MFRVSWLFVVLFGLAVTGATLMNISLVNRARAALNEGILGTSSSAILTSHVAVVIPDTRDSFFDGLIAGVQSEAARAGAAVQVFRYHGASPYQDETWFQLCLSARVDGVIFYSSPDLKTASRRAAAVEAGVIFVPLGTQVPAGETGSFIGSSRLLQGVEAGYQLAQKLGSSARVGVLLSSETEGPVEADPVYQGVKMALKNHPGARIVQAVRARPGILSGEEAASTLLRSAPSVNVLVCATAPVTEGAAQVVIDQGRVGQVHIVGTDESPTIDRLVDRGVILATIVRDSRRMGAEALRAFEALRLGREPPILEVGYTVRTQGDNP